MALLTASASLLAAPCAFAQTATTVDDVVVTASTRAQKIEQAPATITLITAEQLEGRAYSDLFDAVRDVEGVSVSGGSNFQDIFIRGLPGAYTLTLVDG
ncbi:MAG: TonB-dependent receptor plug domain-containing protein, partial [Brevundimonas sp.]